jgi:hypothetical protein
MALQEEPGEHPQRGWFSRYSRERRDLSASVEDALAVSSEQQWDEEDDEVGLWSRSKQNGSLIPPRLSLQSKQLSTVHSGGFVETTAEMQPDVSAFAKTPKSTASTPQTPRVNLWTRVAQRITTSLVALGSTTYPEAFPVLPVSLREEPQFLSWQHEISLLPPPISQDGVYSTDNPPFTSPSVQTFDALAGRFSAYPPSTEVSGPTVDPVTPVVRKPRPGGHMTKIRLQTPPASKTSVPTEQDAIETPMPEDVWMGSEIISATPKNAASGVAMVNLPEQVSGTTSDHLPAIEMPTPREEVGHAPLPVVEKAQHDAHNVGLMAFFGSGTIESGQSDISVADAHTTSACVVNVTLTANPGPVVVQYISLQPHAGFTIHLTAPAMASTAFNYVILRGEP